MDCKFTYTRLLVTNFEACFLFYRDVMGFKATYGSEHDIYADFDTGSVALALFSKSAMSDAVGTAGLPAHVQSQDSVCLCFEVDSVDAFCDQLKLHSVSLVSGPLDQPSWGIRVAHFRDPDGNLVEVNQPLPPQPA